MPEESPGDLLRRDHARLEAELAALLDAFAEGTRRDLRAAWGRLDAGLLAHLKAEEEVILPAFSQVDAREADALRGEHSRIRRLLAELGVGVDLHLVPLEVAREFAELLRAHARREDELLYRWVDRQQWLEHFAAEGAWPPVA